jgi:hypothetical protein
MLIRKQPKQNLKHRNTTLKLEPQSLMAVTLMTILLLASILLVVIQLRHLLLIFLQTMAADLKL